MQEEDRAEVERRRHPDGRLAEVITKNRFGEKEGPYQAYHRNGRLKEDGRFVRDRREGAWSEYFENGKLRRRVHYRRDVLEGAFVAHHENGKMSGEGLYREGRLEGVYRSYHGNGKLSEEGSYRKGDLEGEARWYHESGRLACLADVVRGFTKVNGRYHAFFASGHPSERATYKDRKLEGLHELFHENGMLRQRASYRAGRLEGKTTSYYPDGKLREEASYRDNERHGPYRDHHANGRVREEGRYEAGVYHGAVRIYFEDGRRAQELTYARGKRHGRQRSYYRNGKLEADEEYEGGERHGRARWTFDDGKLACEARFERGKLEGGARLYTDEGKLREELEYAKGVLTRRKHYDEKGKLKFDRRYLEDAPGSDLLGLDVAQPPHAAENGSVRWILLVVPLILTSCPRPPAPGAPDSSFVLQPPFPCGTRLRVICGYGCAAHARLDDPRRTNEHYAVDFLRDDGRNGFDRPVAAVAPGVVLRAGWTTGGWAPYGQMVYLEHDYRDRQGHRYQSIYAHLHRVLVRPGQRVDAGSVLGTLGGSSDGKLRRFAPHLHFAMFQDARRSLGGGRAFRPEPLGGYRDLRKGLTMTACVPPGPALVASMLQPDESAADRL